MALSALAGCSDKKDDQDTSGGLGPPGTYNRDRARPSANPDVVEAGDHVWVEYTGKLQDGTTFDSSVGKPPLEVKRVGAGNVIKGFDDGLVGMKIGQSKTLTIPPEDGYGAGGSPPKIPPNATLTFQVKIIRLTKGGGD